MEGRAASAHWTAVFATALACTLPSGHSPARAGPALAQYEIKEIGSTPGAIEIQSQNDFSFGNPTRRFTTNDDGELTADENSVSRQREGLEIEMGLTSFVKLRLGVEFEQERIDDPTTFGTANAFNALRFDSYGAETIWTLLPRKGDGFGIGVLIEYEQSAHADESSQLNVGPIFEWQNGRWSAAFNPILTKHFGGEGNDEGKRDNKIDFGYAARIMYRTSEQFAAAVEAYGTIDRIGSTGSPNNASRMFGDFDQHRIGPVLYWTFEDDDAKGDDEKNDGREIETTLGLGALVGLNENTPAVTMKLSLEVDF
ncbi:hypothetical protein DLM45_12895 [Hyphomicrobium methylovorum]|uniref:hypothetical protein n=1 Tax=Hyphomicrobium methylovorum TaxID=84 RepID=UPI0015E6AF14|nr:hypothetical protein [Hyphomicrobium methylovorum]MBA2127110.1 hypothetical protein [Hyphomicrobium methylovorum]